MSKNQQQSNDFKPVTIGDLIKQQMQLQAEDKDTSKQQPKEKKEPPTLFDLYRKGD